MVLVGFNWFWFGFGSNWFWLVLVGDGSGPALFLGPKVTMSHGHGNLSKCWAHTRLDRTQNQGGNGAQ
jgi:hypothetical protein